MASVRTAALVRSTHPAFWGPIAPTAGDSHPHHHHHHHRLRHHHQNHHHNHHHHHHHPHRPQALRLPYLHHGSPMEASSNAQTHALFQTMASATTVALVLIRLLLILRLRRPLASTPALPATTHRPTERTCTTRTETTLAAPVFPLTVPTATSTLGTSST